MTSGSAVFTNDSEVYVTATFKATSGILPFYNQFHLCGLFITILVLTCVLDGNFQKRGTQSNMKNLREIISCNPEMYKELRMILLAEMYKVLKMILFAL